MLKNKKKIGVMGCIFALAIGCIPIVAANVAPNGNFSATASCGNLEGSITAVAENATVISSSSWCDRGGTVSASAQAGSSGTASLSIITVDTTDVSKPLEEEHQDKPGKILSSVVVNITQPATGGTPATGGQNNKETPPKKEEIDTKDTVSTLSSLTINTGTLSPAFAADITSYSVQLPAGIKELQVNATPASAKASISGIGKVSVNTGGNTIEILCTAENGASTTYTITANVSETPVAMVQMGDKKFGVLNSDVNPGKLFVKVKIKIAGKEVDAWSNEELGMKLLYLQDEKTSEKNFYMYDEATKKVTSIYKPFAYAGKNLVQVDVPENLQQRKGMNYTKVVMGPHQLSGWKFNDKKFDNYIIVYVLDETGKAVYYQYDKKEDTLQRFSQAAAISQDKYEAYVKKMEKQTTFLFIGLLVAALVAILFFVLILVIIIRRKKNKYKKVNINRNQQQSNISLEAAALMHDNLDKQ